MYTRPKILYVNFLSPFPLIVPLRLVPIAALSGEMKLTKSQTVFTMLWGYDTTYWYPLKGEFDDSKLFISPHWLVPHMDEINQLLGIPNNHIYEYGKSWYSVPHCAEVDKPESYAGCETAYFSKDFSWIIYYSHENTVTFAGIIVSKIKEILYSEKEHWNRR